MHQLFQTSNAQLNEGNTSHQSLRNPNPFHTRLDYNSLSQ